MAGQIIEVPDISIVRTVDGVKQLFSLRDQQIKKDASLHEFGSGSGVVCNGDLYVLNASLKHIVKFITTANKVSLSIGSNSDIFIDWGDGIKDSHNSHDYIDELNEHTITLYGTNIDLIRFWCQNIPVTFLDISCNLNLTELVINDINLSLLDITKNTRLAELNCNNNQLTSLNTMNNPELMELYCGNNKLSSLDVSKCIELEKLNIAYNPFVTIQSEMLDLANSLPNRTGKESGMLTVFNTTARSWIQSICDAKNWKTQ